MKDARTAFKEYAAQYYSYNEWLDIGSDDHFIAGYKACLNEMVPKQELILLGLQYIEWAAYSVEREEDAASLRKQLEEEWKDEER